MMKIILKHNEFTLGNLTISPEGYLWTPNESQIMASKEKYPLAMEMFFLPSKNTIFKTIPRHYRDFLESSSRPDLKEKAKIEDGDSDFIKVYKMSFLEYFNIDFIIKH